MALASARLARAARRYPNVLLVNWHNAIAGHQRLLWSDDIHPQPVGGKLYAKVVRSVVLQALHRPPRLSMQHGTMAMQHRTMAVQHRTMAKSTHLTGFLLRANYATLY